MKKVIMYLTLLYFLFIFAGSAWANAEDGVFSYPSNIEKNILIPLKGQWEFYWYDLLTPEDFNNVSIKSNRKITTVPHGKYGFEVEGKRLSSTGYATYRLLVMFPNEEIGNEKALYIPNIASAYTVWVNGEKRAESGKVGISANTMIPATTPSVVPFMVTSQVTEIVIQSSNYHQRKGGMTSSVLLGEVDTVLKYKTEKLIIRTAVFVSLVVIGLYHVALYFFRRKEKTLAFFGLVCLSISLRGAILEEEIHAFLFSYYSFEFLTKIEYLGAMLGVLFLTLFSNQLFKGDMNQIVKVVVGTLTIIFSLFVLLTPAIVFTQFIQVSLIIVFIGFMNLIYVYVVALMRRREGAILNGISMFVLFLCVMNDLLFYSDYVQTVELTTIGTIVFLFSQTINIAKRYSMALANSENMSRQLEQLVKERTNQLEQANRQLLIVNRKLEKAHESRTKLINDISHEIATPLTNIQAYTRGMLDKIIPMDKKHIQLVHDKGLFLSKLLEDFRSLVHLETKNMKFHFEETEARNYFTAIYERNLYELEKQGVAFQFEDNVTKGEQIYIQIDEVRMEQVIRNLLSNAMKFVKEDGKITLKIERDERTFIVTVSDNGIGTNEEELPYIFDRYYSNSRGLADKGSGLGLAITKEIVKRHGGTIEVESEEGKGSSFSIYLPIVKFVSKN